MIQDKRRLRIALQKSGRLHAESMEILKLCGLKFSPGPRQLLCRSGEMPLDLLFIRDDDIPSFVAEGICDLGMAGQNIFEEASCGWAQQSAGKSEQSPPFAVRINKKMGFSLCRLSLAAPAEFELIYRQRGPKSLEGRRIATSYPASLNDFLRRRGVRAEIVKMNGSVELAPKLQIADLICDLVSTGSTLVANDLVECHSLLQSEAVLLEHSGPRNDWTTAKRSCLAQLLSRLESVLRARNSKYVMMNAPKNKIPEISALLPGADSPTVIPLADAQQVAIHVVSAEPVVWETMEALKAAGAHSILIQPIEKMLF